MRHFTRYWLIGALCMLAMPLAAQALSLTEDTTQTLTKQVGSPTDAAWGDLNGDGYTDVVDVGFQGVEYWLNNGAGVFQGFTVAIPSDLNNVAKPNAVAVADFNADGYADIFVGGIAANSTSNGGANWILLNNGNGTFTDSGQRLNPAGHSMDVAVGDLNGDGYADALVCNNGRTSSSATQSPYNEVWLNDGTGTMVFHAALQGQLQTGQFWNCWSVALDDLDKDGDLDAVFGMDAPNEVWLNDGVGNFTSTNQVLGTGRTKAIALGDLNGDGYSDMFSFNGYGGTSYVWINDGTGTFTQDITQNFPYPGARSAVMADMNNDGYADVLLSGTNISMDFLQNDGLGNLTSNLTITTGNGADGYLAVADFDGDTDLDAFVANGYGGGSNYFTNDLIVLGGGTGGGTGGGCLLASPAGANAPYALGLMGLVMVLALGFFRRRQTV